MKKPLRIKNTKTMGRGIFAPEHIKRGVLIHVSELLKIPLTEIIYCPTLEKYVFGYDKKHSVMALGLGSLFNHSEEPNVEAWHGYKDDREIMEFRTICQVKKGQQLFIDYGKNYPFDVNMK